MFSPELEERNGKPRNWPQDRPNELVITECSASRLLHIIVIIIYHITYYSIRLWQGFLLLRNNDTSCLHDIYIQSEHVYSANSSTSSMSPHAISSVLHLQPTYAMNVAS